MPDTTPRFPEMSIWKQLLLLFGLLFIGMCLTGFAGELMAGLTGRGTRATLLTVAAVQNILCFAAPVIILYRLTRPHPWQWGGFTAGVPSKSVLAMIALYALALPALNQTIWWNDHLNLPPSLHSLQDTFMTMEAQAREATETMLGGSSVGVLIVNILLVGILTGVCEEIFFRAGLQRILSEKMSRTAAIWLSALVFSVMHMQFFGFVPRLLLGAFFGYLYAATGSIWLNAAAHALNNSLVVVFSWLTERGADTGAIDMFGVTTSGYPLPAVVSGVLVAAVFIFVRKKLFYPLSSDVSKKG